MKKTAAVIVAAGCSSRMGELKALLPIGGVSLLRRIAGVLLAAGASPTVLVTGYRADELQRETTDLGLVFLRNERYAETEMFDSARIGFSYLEGKCDRVLFTPVDVPLFAPGTVKRLLATDVPLAVPVCGGKRGHPILLSAALLPALIRDSGEDGLKGALRRAGAPAHRVEVPDEGILYDADTPADYRALLDLYERQNG